MRHPVLGPKLHQMDSRDNPLTWNTAISPSLRRWLFFIITLCSLVLVCLLGIESIQREKEGEQLKPSVLSEKLYEVSDQDRSFMPSVLPMPSFRDTEGKRRIERFRIPDADFALQAFEVSVTIPEAWRKERINAESTLFFGTDRFAGELSYIAGCLGSCDTIKENISQSSRGQLKLFHSQGYISHLLHWQVLDQGSSEYAILYKDTKEQYWIHGASLRWEQEWINAIKCQYTAPITLQHENEEVLHLVWDRWASRFLSYCRDYQLLSSDL